jgi:hypothetical protein
MPESVRAAADIWQALRTKRGPELVKGLVDELAALHQLCNELGRLIQQLQIQQSFSGHLFALEDASNAGARLPTQLHIYAAQLLEPQEGFYSLEYEDDGVPFRWTGPQRHFSFRVNIDRQMPLVIELEVRWLMDEPRQRDLNLLVDGHIFPFRLMPGGPGFIGRTVLPATDRQAMTNLTFVVPATVRLGFGAADQRELGIAFRKLAIQPAGAEASAALAAEMADAGRTSGEDSATAVPMPAEALTLVPAAAAIAGPRRRDPDETLVDGPGPAAAGSSSCTAADIRDGHPGFYSLEHDQDGAPFRWTGNQSSSFSLSLSIDRRMAIELELRAISVINRRRQLPLVLEVDGAKFPLAIKWAGDHLAGRLVIPARAAAGPTLLTFSVPVLLRPRGSDRRELGIAFSELHLRPAETLFPPRTAGLEQGREGHAEYGAAGATPAPVP